MSHQQTHPTFFQIECHYAKEKSSEYTEESGKDGGRVGLLTISRLVQCHKLVTQG